MTEKQAKTLIRLIKIFVIALFVMFFVIISIQSIQISTLKNKKNVLQSDLTQKQYASSTYENEIENIENNFDKYSEEKLRKEEFKKNDEILVK